MPGKTSVKSFFFFLLIWIKSHQNHQKIHNGAKFYITTQCLYLKTVLLLTFLPLCFFSRRHRRWIILWTVRLMAHRRSWMIKMRPQPVRWAGWLPSKTGRGSWSQHRPLPAEFWWDDHTQTPTKASLDAHKLSHILPQSHSEHLTLIFIHFLPSICFLTDYLDLMPYKTFVTCYDTISTLLMTFSVFVCFCQITVRKAIHLTLEVRIIPRWFTCVLLNTVSLACLAQ